MSHVYKVVRLLGDGMWSFVATKYAIRYVFGEVVRPVVAGSPLMCFESEYEAMLFAHINNAFSNLLLCEAEFVPWGGDRRLIIPRVGSVPSEWLSRWWSTSDKDDVSLPSLLSPIDPPRGTVMCEEVKLTKPLSMMYSGGWNGIGLKEEEILEKCGVVGWK